MNKLLTGLLAFGSISAFADQNCNLFIIRDRANPHMTVPLPRETRQALASKGFNIVSDPSAASYELTNVKQCQVGPALGTYCQFDFIITTDKGQWGGPTFFHNRVETFDLEVLWVKGKHHRALINENFSCVNGEIKKNEDKIEHVIGLDDISTFEKNLSNGLMTTANKIEILESGVKRIHRPVFVIEGNRNNIVIIEANKTSADRVCEILGLEATGFEAGKELGKTYSFNSALRTQYFDISKNGKSLKFVDCK